MYFIKKCICWYKLINIVKKKKKREKNATNLKLQIFACFIICLCNKYITETQVTRYLYMDSYRIQMVVDIFVPKTKVGQLSIREVRPFRKIW